ncbi:MAG: T9SS type A sorting domain-containing protein [Bacteroidales bacterium]|nr:T9SS type A sorting domain-containing protein [Bacteroidales bacterium]
MKTIRRSVIFLFFILFISFTLNATQATGHSATGSEIRKGITLVTVEQNRIVLHYSSDIPVFRKKIAGQEEYFTLDIPGHIQITEEGIPAIPAISRLIDLTGIEITKIKLKEVNTTRIFPGSKGFSGQMYPVQPGLTKNRLPQERPFIKKHSAYKTDSPVIRDTVTITTNGILRGQTIGVLQVNPVIYHAASNYIDLIESMDIIIEFTGSTSPVLQTKGLRSDNIKGVLNKGLVYYNEEDVIPAFSLLPSGLIILSDTLMKKHLKPLADWKRVKGYNVIELYVGENGLERNYESIKDTLTYIYQNATDESPAPDYLMIAGDLNIIPQSEGASALSDLYYSEFDGEGDYLPDMFTGRLPAKDTTQMKAIVRKILQYEKFEFGDTINHYKNAMLVAGYDAGNVSYINGQLFYGHDNYLNIDNKVTPYVFYHQNDASLRAIMYDSVKTLFNSGVGFVNYTGHGSATAWLSTGIDYSFPPTMTNQSRYPVIISNACKTAQFTNSNNFGSSFVRAEERGALAFIGCTVDSYWDEDFYWSVGVSSISSTPTYDDSGPGFYDRLFHSNGEAPSDWYTSLGQVLFAGNLAVLSSTSPRKKYYWEYYVLLGDPSITPFIGTPGTFDITLPDTLPTDLKSFGFSVDPFSYVAISHFDTLWDATHATPSGAVNLSIPVLEKDSCQVVITGQNMIPLIKTIYFAESDTAWININDVNPRDPLGNNNDLADYSEQISLSLDLQNAGNTGIDNVYATVTSSSEYITVTNGHIMIGTMPALSEITIDAFDIIIADSIPDLEITPLNIKIFYGINILDFNLDISLHGPEPAIIDFYIDDYGTGNGNGLPEAGETFDVIFRITNNGSSAYEGNLSLSNINSYITFDDLTLPTGIINPSEIVELPISATLLPGTPEAEVIGFETKVEALPYYSSKSLSFIAGNTTEDFELQEFTTFPWSNSGDHPWVIDNSLPYSNQYSAHSSYITHSEKSILSMYLNLPEDDTLEFWYKVSSENNFDWFSFYSDSVQYERASGETDWQQAIIPLNPGVHYLEWVYAKDASVNFGDDRAWIDLVKFPLLSFLDNDIALNKIINPVLNKEYHDEEITVELTNIGRDTLSTISLTYTVENNPTVNEVFNVDLLPGDTTQLTFTQLFDFSSAGTYSITIYQTAPDDYAANDTTKSVVISTGINDIITNSNEFKVGPNPFKDHICIQSKGEFHNVTIEIVTFSGTVMIHSENRFISPGEVITMDSGLLQQGTYILRISSSKGIFIYRLLKL